MNKRKILQIGTSLLFVAGVLLAAVPFLFSLGPNAKSEAALARIKIDVLEPGKSIRFKHPYLGEALNGFEWYVLMYKKYNGTIRAWNLPVKGEFVGMPDAHWWRPSHMCYNFGPTGKEGAIDETLPIKCHDKNQNLAREWEWDIDGKSKYGERWNMLETKGVIEGNHFVFGKNS